ATFAWWPVAHAMRATIQAVPVAEQSDNASGNGQDAAGSSEGRSSDGGSLDGWLDSLRPELAAVIRRRYAAAGVRPRREVARALGLSEYQVRAREAEAMRELTAVLAKVGDRAPQ